MPRFTAIGFTPAATADALTENRLRQYGGGRGAVAATSDVFEAPRAPFVRPCSRAGLQVDLFRHRHAIFGDVRPAEFLFRMTFRP